MAMDLSSAEAEIVWGREATKRVPLFCTIPDTGLIGFVSSVHIIQESEMDLLGFVDAPWVPPVVVVQDGLPYPPVRIYGSDRISILLLDVPLESDLWHTFSDLAVRVYREAGAKAIIGATGLPNPKRQEVKELRLFTSFTDPSLMERFSFDAKEFNGVMAGPYASLLQLTLKNNIPSLVYLIDSYPAYPDPEAAALIVDLLGRMIDVEFDVQKLLDKGAELRIRARQLALETQRKQMEAQAMTGRASAGFYM